MNEKYYDERQLNVRGKIFRTGYFVLAIYMILNAVILDTGNAWASNYHIAFIGIMISVCVCNVQMIITDSYIGKARRSKLYINLISIFTIILLIESAIGIVHEGFFFHGQITSNTTSFITAVILAVICITYWIKHFIDKREYD